MEVLPVRVTREENREKAKGVIPNRNKACHAGATADARSRIHGHVGIVLWDRNRVGIRDASSGRADVASCLDDLVEGGAVYHEVADDGERLRTPWLNPYFVAILELAHVELASGDAVVVAMGATVDIESAHAADALATIVVEAHGMRDAVVDETLVQDVEHFEK